MPTVRLDFSPVPAVVRTVRLATVAVARHAGLAETYLDAVRQAIGEACSLAVARHRRVGSSELIRVVITDDDVFSVRVVDRAEVIEASVRDNNDETIRFPVIDSDEEERAFADETALALLKGLVERFSLNRLADGGTEVTMAWPLSGRR
jgi:hypothetical protein